MLGPPQPRRLDEPSRFAEPVVPRHPVGGMFWFRRKRFVGS
jgi:hypothetical protein